MGMANHDLSQQWASGDNMKQEKRIRHWDLLGVRSCLLSSCGPTQGNACHIGDHY